MAFQISEEIFQRIKRHMEREMLRTGKASQQDFARNLLTQALRTPWSRTPTLRPLSRPV